MRDWLQKLCRKAALRPLFRAACLAAWGLPLAAGAQTTISNASLTSLQTALASGGTITLAFDGTIATSSPLIVSVDNTVLDATGHSVTISGGGSNRVFDIATNVHFTVTNLTISGGSSAGVPGLTGTTGSDDVNKGGNGGPGGNAGNGLGGGVRNRGISVFVNCLFSDNHAAGGAGGAGGNGGNAPGNTGGNGGNGGNGGTGFGGGIYNLGSVYLTNCSFVANTATGGSGGGAGSNGAGVFASYPGSGGSGGVGSGAALYNLGSVIISNCTFNQNTAQGGGSPGAGGPPQANGNGLTGQNGADSQGGAICNLGTNSIVNSTFYLNSAAGGGGATGGPGTAHGGNGGTGGNAWGGSLYNTNGGLLNVTNCTISDGVANGGAGGGAGTGPFAGVNGGNGVNHGDLIANNGGTFNFKNSLLAFATDSAVNSFRQLGTNSFGAITDLGNNLSSDAFPTLTAAGSHNNLDPIVEPLANNGGLTLTMSLGLDSPAVDGVLDASAPPVDQRGFPRPFPIGGRSDIGAFESGSTVSNFTVSGQITIGLKPFPGVTVTANGSPVTTDTNGGYSFVLPSGVAYTISPAPSAYFSPSSASLTLTNNATFNFNATNAPATISRTNTNGTVQVTFSSIPGFSYRIQASTNLSSPTNWVTVATNVAVSNLIVFTNSSTNFPQLFFRTITP